MLERALYGVSNRLSDDTKHYIIKNPSSYCKYGVEKTFLPVKIPKISGDLTWI